MRVIRKVVERGKWKHVAEDLNLTDFPNRMTNFLDLEKKLRRLDFLLNENSKSNKFTVERKFKMIDI